MYSAFVLLYSIVYVLDRSLIDSSTSCAAEQVLTCINMMILLLLLLLFVDAADNARLLCDQFYFTSPDVTIREHNGI